MPWPWPWSLLRRAAEPSRWCMNDDQGDDHKGRMFAPLSRVVITVPPARAKLWIAAAADCDSTVAFCNSSTCTWDEMLARGGTSCLLCEGPVARQYHCKPSLARNPVNIERAKFVSGWRARSADSRFSIDNRYITQRERIREQERDGRDQDRLGHAT